MIDIHDMNILAVNIWEKVIYESERIVLDIYYLKDGFPKMIHDEYGAKELDIFRNELLNKIKSENHADSIWRVLSDGYAVPYKSDNIPEFTYTYKKFTYEVKKKKLTISPD